MKIVVLGASGIIGQFMRLCVPPGISVSFYRRSADPHDPFVHSFDARRDTLRELFARESPDVVVNLIGESHVDHVERAMDMHSLDYDAAEAERIYHLNVAFPGYLAEYCSARNVKYVHVSSQAVFDGTNPPYGPNSPTASVNEYGSQKIRAEALVMKYKTTVLVRPSLVLGVRPFPHEGRKNPLESMLDGSQTEQVCDRWFSPLFAQDAARGMWIAALDGEHDDIIHLGVPERWSRFEIAKELGGNSFTPVPHSNFSGSGDAERPIDTTYKDSWPSLSVPESIRDIVRRYDITDRAREIALFFGMREDEAYVKLNSGFSVLHNEVTEDFHKFSAGANDQMLRNWYMHTSAYIWELSAYHEHPGFNYVGMCEGIADRLLLAGGGSVLVLGDGIGDMTLYFRQRGLEAYYHDLAGSKTARFANFRYWRKIGATLPTTRPAKLNAVVAADFLEHVNDVEGRVRSIYADLRPGGLFFAQNAFACGSGPDGPMPMHLASNDHWERDWDPLLSEVGFVQESSNWYRKPE